MSLSQPPQNRVKKADYLPKKRKGHTAAGGKVTNDFIRLNIVISQDSEPTLSATLSNITFLVLILN